MVLFPIISNKALFLKEAIAYLKYVVNSGGGGGPPRAAKLGMCLKNWKGKNILRGKNIFWEGISKKRSSKKFLGMRQKSRGAAPLKGILSLPGTRFGKGHLFLDIIPWFDGCALESSHFR